MNKKLLERIEYLFKEKLQEKTNWGRKKVILAYKEAVNQAILEMIDSEKIFNAR